VPVAGTARVLTVCCCSRAAFAACATTTVFERSPLPIFPTPGTFSDYIEFQHSDDLDLGIDSQPLLDDAPASSSAADGSARSGAGSAALNGSAHPADGVGAGGGGGRVWKAITTLWRVSSEGAAVACGPNARGKGGTGVVSWREVRQELFAVASSVALMHPS